MVDSIFGTDPPVPVDFEWKEIDVPQFEIKGFDTPKQEYERSFASGFDSRTFLTILALLVIAKFVIVVIYYIASKCRKKRPSIIIYETLVVTPRSDYAAGTANNSTPSNDPPPMYNDAVKPNTNNPQQRVVQEV